MHTYTPDPDNFPASITLPDDGDDEDATSVNDPFEDTVDRTAYITKHYPLDATTTLIRSQPMSLVPVSMNSETPITPQWGWAGPVWVQNDTTFTVAVSIDCPLDLPHDATLNSVEVVLNGKLITGHSSLPATMPAIRVFKTNISTGTATPISSLTTDPSGTVGAYDVAHTVTATVGAAVDRVGYSYSVRIIGESGANSVAGLNICGIVSNCDVANLDKGAS